MIFQIIPICLFMASLLVFTEEVYGSPVKLLTRQTKQKSNYRKKHYKKKEEELIFPEYEDADFRLEKEKSNSNLPFDNQFTEAESRGISDDDTDRNFNRLLEMLKRKHFPKSKNMQFTRQVRLDIPKKIPKSNQYPTKAIEELTISVDYEEQDVEVGVSELGTWAPNTDIPTVCIGQPQIYNKPAVGNWLRTSIYTNWDLTNSNNRHEKVLLMNLRKLIHKQGRSDECHSPKLKSWRSFLNCELRRHQRVEYLVPMYPLHQIYFHHLLDKDLII